MRLLLDTHAVIWAVSEPEKLSATARDALEDPANQLWVSSVSLFEVATKVRLGKLADPGPLLKNWEWTLARLGAGLLALAGASAIQAGSLSVEHRDPFDRLLAAQALQDDLRLVTRDPAFGLFPGLSTLW